MKSFFAILFFGILIISNCQAQEIKEYFDVCDHTELSVTKMYRIIYAEGTKNTKVPYKEYLQTGELVEEGMMKQTRTVKLAKKRKEGDSPFGVTHKKEGKYIQYYKSGQKKKEGFRGGTDISTKTTFWRENGTIQKTISYHPDKTKEIQTWYKDGQKHIHYFKLEKLEKRHYPYRYISLYDSLGKQLIKNGQGNYSDSTERGTKHGPVVNGLPHGEWKGTFNEGSAHFNIQFENGRIIKGTSTDSKGKQYEFDQILVHSKYPGGIKDMYRTVSKRVRFPKQIKKRRIPYRKTVFTAFVVKSSGDYDDINVLGGQIPEIETNIKKGFSKLKKFDPGLYCGQPFSERMIIPITFVLP